MRLAFCVIRTNILQVVIFLLFVLSAFFLIPSLCQSQQEISTDSPPIKITEGWQYRWGDSPIDENGVPIWTYEDISSSEWKPTTSTKNPPERNGRKNLWLRVRLPEEQWKNPALFTQYVFQTFEVYLDDKLIYKSGELKPSGKNKFAFLKWQIIPIEPNYPKSRTPELVRGTTPLPPFGSALVQGRTGTQRN
ncbi:hypothetical protein H8E77_14045 [bacterium]|nr:hypothetical protein [bacterium]